MPQLKQDLPNDVPHSRQNLALPGLSYWQREHFMVDSCLCLISQRNTLVTYPTSAFKCLRRLDVAGSNGPGNKDP